MIRHGMKLAVAAVAFGGLLAAAQPASATNVLVSAYPWGQNQDVSNMTDVFGGDFTTYDSFGAVDAASVFTSSTKFAFLEGGDGTNDDFISFLSSAGSTILNWVNQGGRLLVQSAGWTNGFTFGPATFTYSSGSSENYSGTLTAAGQAAFTAFPTPTTQSGSFLAHDTISGPGLTTFMNGDDNGAPIIAGTSYGLGYILFSGLTDSQFHYAGQGLVDDEIAFAATVSVATTPIPAALPLFASALGGLGFIGWRRKQANAA